MNLDRVMRPAVAMVMSASLLASGTVADAGEVRIVAADGRIAAEGRVRVVVVRPGQVVSLAADEAFVDTDGRVEYARRPPEDFAWQADDPPDRCDPAVGCPSHSHFEVTPYGVNYYVPWDPPARIRIRASLKGGPASDVVDLVRDEGESGRPAWERELDGLGYWVVIADTRAFVPVAYVEGWTPYRHGYWYWTAFGWTWYSFDPWGAITDHCGHWRHHRWYGWVWVPDPVCAWRPAVVTFFLGPMWIGWYPYDPGRTYWYGYEHGFDDGYWLGYAVGRAAEEGRATPGFVATTYEDFYSDNQGKPDTGGSGRAPGRPNATASRPGQDLSRVRLADPVAANEAFNEAVRKGHVGPVPGGGSDPADGWKFWARKTGVRPTEVPLETAALRPGRWFEPVTPPAKAPAEYREASTRIRTSTGELGGGIRHRRVGVGQALGARDARSGSPAMGVAPPPAGAPSRLPRWTDLPSDPGRVMPPAKSYPAEPVRESPHGPPIPPRQWAPREYRVVPAEPPSQPTRAPEPARPTTRPARPSDPVPAPAPVRVAPVRPSQPRVDVDHQPAARTAPDRRVETGAPPAPPPDSPPILKPAGSAPPRPVPIPPAARSLPPIRKVAPASPNPEPKRR